MGLLNYPNSFVPDTLAGHTSGTEKASGQTCAETDYASAWCGMELGPFDSVPSVGFSDIEPVLDADGNRVTGEFWCTTDNGFGNSANSWDYPLHIHKMKIQKPFTFRHGESTFDRYTETESLGVSLLHDPNGLIGWENGADIQVWRTRRPTRRGTTGRRCACSPAATSTWRAWRFTRRTTRSWARS